MFDRLLAPIRRRLRLIVSRAAIRASDDSTALQTLDLGLIGDETRKGAIRIAEYGFASRPPEGAEAVYVCPGGDRAQGVVVATDDRRNRPRDLAEGECCLWTPDSGKRVHCRANGQVDLGSEPEDFVALARAVRAELDAIKGDLDALKAAIEGFNGSFSGTIGGATAEGTVTSTTKVDLTWSPSDVAAEEVRAK